jgi:hypothetical protein
MDTKRLGIQAMNTIPIAIPSGDFKHATASLIHSARLGCRVAAIEAMANNEVV